MNTLRYKPAWIALSALLVAGVVWGSLQTSMHLHEPQGFDKVEHFSSYGFLAVWFTGLYARARWGWVALALLALGASMELAQYLMHAGRTADVFDMAANGAGVIAGCVLAFVATGGWAARVEAWLKR